MKISCDAYFSQNVKIAKNGENDIFEFYGFLKIVFSHSRPKNENSDLPPLPLAKGGKIDLKIAKNDQKRVKKGQKGSKRVKMRNF